MSEDLPDEVIVDQADIEPEVPAAEDVEVDEPVDDVDDDLDTDDDVEVVQPQGKQAGQADKSGMVARVKRERKEALRKAEMAEERARLLELQMQQINQMRFQQPQVEENLDPDEKWRRDANASIQRSQSQMQDMLDKNTYEMKALSNPVYKKWADKVEKVLADEKRQGRFWTREGILDSLLGKAVRESASKAQSTVAKKTPARVAAEKTKAVTPGGRSTVSLGKKETSLKEKLKDMRI
jgi:hypothetical protein